MYQCPQFPPFLALFVLMKFHLGVEDAMYQCPQFPPFLALFVLMKFHLGVEDAAFYRRFFERKL
jgi:hypothetical protein